MSVDISISWTQRVHLRQQDVGPHASRTGGVVGRFFAMYGSPNAADVGPVCNDAGGNALAHTFGPGNFTNGFGIDEATGREDRREWRRVLLGLVRRRWRRSAS